MSFQMRPKSGPLRETAYSPQRDIAYLYPNAVQLAENMLYEGREPALAEFLEWNGVDEDALAHTVQKFCQVLNEAHKSPDETWLDILKRTGFEDCPAAARISLMYYIGTIMAGNFFQGLRDIVLLGDDTIVPVSHLMKTSEEIARYLSKGWIGRWWYRFRYRMKNRDRKFPVTGHASPLD